MAEKKISKKKGEESKRVEELEEQVKRSLADYQNLEKRTAEERANWIRKSNKELILRLLPVLDTLILASNHVQNEGLILSAKQFLDILKNEGVEKIETEGRDFDPQFMEAVGTQESEENGKVTREIRPGFKYTDNTVLRPAQVMIGRKK